MSHNREENFSEHILQVVLNDDGMADVLEEGGEIKSKEATITETIDLQTFTVIETINDTNSNEDLCSLYDDDQSEQEIEHEIYELIAVDSKRKRRKRKKGEHSINEPLTSLKKRKNTIGSTRKKFTQRWLLDPLFSRWLEESADDGQAYCVVCHKILQPGRSELIKHANTAKHKRNIFNGDKLFQPSSNDIIKNSVTLSTKKKIKQEKIMESEHIVDLRSECISKQTYRENLEQYSLGDDMYREDHSVLELEKYVSGVLEKDSCLLTLNGTLANNVCILTHCLSRFSLVIAGSQSYIYKNSQGTMCELGKLSMRNVTNLSDGTFDISELKGILREHNHCWPTSTVVCVENTHTLLGGQPLPMDWLDKLGQLCGDYGIPIHMDGVRLGNASVASGETMANLVRQCSSVAFHLDKSFNAIGGCVIAGKKEFINKALRVRNMLGGTIPQAGTIARSALTSLQNFTAKIYRSHTNAISLAEAVSNMNSSFVNVELSEVRTNIVMIKCDNINTTPQKLCERLQTVYDDEAGMLGEKIILKALPFEPNMVRLVVHNAISVDYLRYAMKKLNYVISEISNSCYLLEYV